MNHHNEKILKWEDLYEYGFKYVYFDYRSHRSMKTDLDKKGLPKWLSVKTLFKDEKSSFIEIVHKNPRKQPSYVCKQVEARAWDVVKNN